MPKVRLEDGTLVDVDITNILADDGQNPFVVPAPAQTFTAEDVERIRSEEKTKLYGANERLQQTIDELKGQVGNLTAAEQARLDAAQAEQARLAEEAKQAELDAMKPNDRLEAQLAEQSAQWQSQLANLTESLETERALRQKDQQFNELREYIQSQVAAHTQGPDADIAPEVAEWIGGNSKEEVDANITRAQATTKAILDQIQQTQQPQIDPATGQPVPQVVQDLQQIVPPQSPPTFAGSRAWSGPANLDPAGVGTQVLTAEQIANMPMAEYAQKRKTLIGAAASSQSNRGMFG